MRTITLKRSEEGRILLQSPYDIDLLNAIQQIDRHHRIFQKPLWSFADCTHDGRPVIVYLRELGQKYAKQMDIPFLDQTLDLSPIEQIQQRVALTIDQYKRFNDLLDRIPVNSLNLKLNLTGLTITINQKIERNEYESLRAIADQIISTKEFQVNFSDVEITRIWNNPAISNQPLQSLDLLEDFGDVLIGTLNGSKHICSRAMNAQQIPAIINDKLVYARSFQSVFSYRNIDHATFEIAKKYHLEDDLIEHLSKPEDFEIEVSCSLKSTEYRANAICYKHKKAQEIEWFIAHFQFLVEIGMNITPYSERFASITKLRNDSAIEAREILVNNAIETMRETLLTKSKDSLLDWVEKYLPTDVKKSWNKKKIVDALEISQAFAIEYLKIPDQAKLLNN